ncbi:MAG: GNAT family N-acetyltransferase [Flavobacteriaceae bacterium]|nr:GNAT family N-acetyltransferase [Flavobacteriaceae bacterium]
MIDQFEIKKFKSGHINDFVTLLKQLNPNVDESIIRHRFLKMLTFNNYQSFGFYQQNKLIGIIGGWTLFKIYSGKQLEIDNFIIDNKLQSKGYGAKLLALIEIWAKNNDHQSVELNVYTKNTRAQEFYFSKDYKTSGFHMIKVL